MAHRWRTTLQAAHGLRRLAADGAPAELRASVALLVNSSQAPPAASWQRARASSACAHHSSALAAAFSAARPPRCNLGVAAQAAYLRDVCSFSPGRPHSEGFHTGAARLHEEKERPAASDADEPPAAPAPSAAESTSSGPLVYEGALAETVRRVKLLSLTSLVLTVFGAPLLVHLSSPESLSMAVKFSLTASLVGFGTVTTALLQWFCSPYVLRLEVGGRGDIVQASTLNVWARPVVSSFPLSAMEEPRTMRPLATFQVGRKIYFIDGTASDELLQRLGLKKVVHAKPSEDEDDD